MLFIHASFLRIHTYYLSQNKRKGYKKKKFFFSIQKFTSHFVTKIICNSEDEFIFRRKKRAQSKSGFL
ncbi:hypothetical protein LEP1GSC036_1263 [Leptospira weilii str. 2006001853]|uniref:Uncharacterized protein n=3 Tax=Leptospira weilii TaxID=28184 RepID=A0A828Z324_9LEPT|nr:hypothetical protein LEP1GSC036_1263 [Leptospira weilii str. 2006001853]EMJ63015.1 hypothetical protein LEP1GSC051_1868 [Leptospira sp. P2653]EMM70513.1 hypothetical protein LEP1GSC038_1124 [Leptospira weilii str. 2006001855]EMN43161.1 hypothetical protein LEP1GSC086_0349 [Leptospira weilii str. LNT 1234]EMN89747.1 hypothetical protein LEP1GSC108_2568 [Leptospira weilii str. UI 13098]OMI18388.1 hypothetical protein BUQ74_05430 [Leptospira weilii serovar Heyan]QDK23594.1 hypothetical protei